MENEKQKSEEGFSLIEYFLSLLDRFMGKKPGYEADTKFFEDDKNLYDEEGELTPAYQQKIKEYERYLKENNMNDFLKGEVCQDETDRIVVDTVCEYSDRRRELMADYERARKEGGRDFDPDQWVEERVLVYGKSEKEKEELSVLMQELLAENADVALDDPDTRADMESSLKVLKGKEVHDGLI